MIITEQETKVDPKRLKDLPIIDEKPKSEKEEKWLKEVDTYEFFNLEEPGVSLTFPYGTTKKNTKFTLFHGGKYSLPRHVARFVENRTTPIHDFRPNGMGQMVKKQIGTKPRFQMRQVMSA